MKNLKSLGSFMAENSQSVLDLKSTDMNFGIQICGDGCGDRTLETDTTATENNDTCTTTWYDGTSIQYSHVHH